jgi:hypothetical protein
MQFSALVFVLYINSLVSVGLMAAFSVNMNIHSHYHATATVCPGTVSSDVYLSTVSIMRALADSVVHAQEEREDDQAHAHNVIVHYSHLKHADPFSSASSQECIVFVCVWALLVVPFLLPSNCDTGTKERWSDSSQTLSVISFHCVAG